MRCRCFWGRQKDFVDTEMQLGRNIGTSTAVVGYAGGKQNSNNTCYYYNAPDTLYEKQGHAEVVQVGIDLSQAEKEFGAFSETYFSQFQKTRFGMIRLVRSVPHAYPPRHPCTVMRPTSALFRTRPPSCSICWHPLRVCTHDGHRTGRNDPPAAGVIPVALLIVRKQRDIVRSSREVANAVATGTHSSPHPHGGHMWPHAGLNTRLYSRQTQHPRDPATSAVCGCEGKASRPHCSATRCCLESVFIWRILLA